MSFNGKPLSDHDREVARAYLEGKFGTKWGNFYWKASWRF
jgi:hypothetical protein